jgi:hypothetical protein
MGFHPEIDSKREKKKKKGVEEDNCDSNGWYPTDGEEDREADR